MSWEGSTNIHTNRSGDIVPVFILGKGASTPSNSEMCVNPVEVLQREGNTEDPITRLSLKTRGAASLSLKEPLI